MVSVTDLLVLSQLPGIGPHRLRRLVSHFGDSARVFSASVRELVRVEGFSRELASRTFRSLRASSLERARRQARLQCSRVNRSGGRIVTFWDELYPEQLRRIYDPPPFFFMLGGLEEGDRYAVAIVGTRRPSRYGIAMAEKFSTELAMLGIVVVSGLARGIDTVAHAAALRSGGRTIAVIGSGVDVIYPRENTLLSRRISARGAVLSEYEMGATPEAANFPRRNRLISGLSLGTLVIESNVDGGAMITANMALDQNREVFALPAALSARGRSGCNTLIKEGKAKLVEHVDDILVELAAQFPHAARSERAENRGDRQEPSFFGNNA